MAQRSLKQDIIKELNAKPFQNNKNRVIYFYGCIMFLILSMWVIIHQLSNTFSASTRRRLIVNGIDANADDYPWMVSLRTVLRNNTNKKLFDRRICGASLIDTDPISIVTAAHCVDMFYLDSARNLMYKNSWQDDIEYAVIGIYADLGRTNDPNYAKQIRSNETFITLNIAYSMIHLHDAYDKDPLKADIALLVISDDQQLPEKYPLVNIAHVNEHKLYDQYKAIGWGSIKYYDGPGAAGADTLQYTVLNYVNDTYCNYIQAKYTWMSLNETVKNLISITDMLSIIANHSLSTLSDDRTICVLGNNSDVCKGDSGGPIFVQEKPDEPILMGVARGLLMGVIECNTQDPIPVPSVFTDVAFYQQWIVDTIDSVTGQTNLECECIDNCDGLKNGDYASCVGCNYYATCSNGLLRDARPCPKSWDGSDLIWNDMTKQCDYTTHCPDSPCNAM